MTPEQFRFVRAVALIETAILVGILAALIV